MEVGQCQKFAMEDIAAVADALIRGEPIRAEHSSLWEHASHCPMCLARIENERVWLDHTNVALQNLVAKLGPSALREAVSETIPAHIEPSVNLVQLGLKWLHGRLELHVRQSADWFGGLTQILPLPAAARGQESAGGIVESQHGAIQFDVSGQELIVTAYSHDFDVTYLVIEALDDTGITLATERTDAAGTARLPVQISNVSEIRIQHIESEERNVDQGRI